jgi:hypothetical protein
MFQRLVNHNDDLRRLVEKGYAVAFDTNCLVVRDIPYLDADGALQTGAFVAKLVFTDQDHIKQDDHQVFFTGSVPHGLDGNPLANLAGGPHQLTLSDACKDVVVQRSFSNKPKITGAFVDFFDKIESYVAIISGAAMEKYRADPYTFRVVEQMVPNSVFKFHDTLTSRAEITELVGRFKDDVIAVIGLGGTGAYVLDFIVKTPVREIRSFDLDPYYVHNAFRSPGRVEEAEFGQLKADVYRARYENFRSGLLMAPKFIDSHSAAELDGVTLAFVCVDKGSARAGIIDVLIAKKIPFIDVGMGLNRKHGALNGMVRVTYFAAADAQTILGKQLVELADTPENVYRTNIQIAELNALNACLAVIRFKQLRGFYLEEGPIYNLLFGISDMKIVSESELT